MPSPAWALMVCLVVIVGLVAALGITARARRGAERRLATLIEELPLPAVLLDGDETVLARSRSVPPGLSPPPPSSAADPARATTPPSGGSRDAGDWSFVRLAGSPTRTVAILGAPGPIDVDAAWWAETTAHLLHKIKNLLQPVLNSRTMVLGRVGATDPDVEEWVDETMEAVDLIKRIATDYAGRQRALAGRRIEPRPVDVGALIRDELAQSTALADLGIAWSFDAPAILPRVGVDPWVVSECLSESLRNAVEALPREGHLSVRVKHDEATPDVVEIVVHDDGPGMGPDATEAALQPFMSTKHGHSGLGLPLMTHLLARVGGTVELRSSLGAGTTLRIRLPVASGGNQTSGPES